MSAEENITVKPAKRIREAATIAEGEIRASVNKLISNIGNVNDIRITTTISRSVCGTIICVNVHVDIVV